MLGNIKVWTLKISDIMKIIIGRTIYICVFDLICEFPALLFLVCFVCFFIINEAELLEILVRIGLYR